jgi:DNA-binding YbaB/EbfC family protein
MINPFKGGLGDLFQQAQKMREEFTRVQEEAGKRTLEVSAGGGMVKVVITGKQQIQSLTIDPEILKLQDREMLQDVIRSAVNQAVAESQAMMAEEVNKLTGGLGNLASLLKGM